MIYLSLRLKVLKTFSRTSFLLITEFPLNPIKISPTPKIAPCLTCNTLLKHFSINFVRISLIIKSGLNMQSTERD